jgi:hypothetical protein
MYIYDHISINSFQNEILYVFIFQKMCSQNHTVYEIVRESLVQPHRAQMTIFCDECVIFVPDY